MRSRAWIGLAGACLAVTACRGDFDASDAGDGDVDNLLGNPSFEDWVGDSVQVWQSDAATLTRSDDAFAGQSSLQLSADTYASVGQIVSASLPLPADTCLRAGAALKWVSGDSSPPVFLLHVTYEDQSEEDLGATLGWVADGEWYEAAGEITLPRTVTAAAANIGGNSGAPHAFLVDAALLRADGCD